RAAITVGPFVHRRRPELLDQRPRLARDLDPIEIALARPPRRRREIVADALHIMVLDDRREGAMDDLAEAGRREGRQPIVDVPALAPPAMGQLDGAFGAMRMDRRRHPPVAFDDGIGRAVDLAVVAGVLGRDRGRAAELGETDPALRLLRLITEIALGDDAAGRIAGRMAGAEEAVADAHTLDVERLEEARIGAHGAGSRC